MGRAQRNPTTSNDLKRTLNTHASNNPHYIFESVGRISEAPSDTVTYLSIGEYKQLINYDV